MRIAKLITCILMFVSTIANADFNATIPVLDLNDYYSKDKRQVFIEKLSDAMQNLGFVAIINSKVDKNVLDNAYTTAQNFYARSSDYKMKCNDPSVHGQRGYVQSESAKGKNQKDFKEFYHIAREYSDTIRSKYNYLPNIWPEDEKFKVAMQELMDELDTYTEVIGRALAESIGEEPEFFNSMTREGSVLLRSLHYPASPPSNTLWAAEHTDIDLFTILPRATEEGLQILNAKNEWIDVIVPDNAVIINAGDMLQNITNGVYKSAVHRVVNKNKNAERYSMVLFVHGRLDDRMDPLPKFVAKVGSKKFASLSSKELLFERLIDLGLHDQALLEDFAQSGAIEKLIDVNRASQKAMLTLQAANLASQKVIDKLKESRG